MLEKRWILDETKPLLLDSWVKKLWTKNYSIWQNEGTLDTNFQNSINVFTLEADEVTDLMKLLDQNFNFGYVKNNFNLVFIYLLNFLCKFKFFLSDVFLKITLKLEQDNSFKTSLIVHSNLSKLKDEDLKLIITKNKEPNLQTIKEYKTAKNPFYYIHKITYKTRCIYLDKLINFNLIDQKALVNINDLRKNIKLEQDLRNQFAHYRISVFNVIKKNNQDLFDKYKFYLKKVSSNSEAFEPSFKFLKTTIQEIYFRTNYNFILKNIIEQFIKAFYLDELI